MDNGGSGQDFFASLMNFFNEVNEVIWADWVLYAVLAVPLILGNDLAALSPASRALLVNRGLVNISQDKDPATGA